MVQHLVKALRKNFCKFNNSDKKRYCERLEKQPLNFLQYIINTVICVFFVRSMDFQHRICQRLILPRLLFAFQIVVECLSADLQSFAVKADFSGVFAVIGSICNIFQSLLFPDF